MGTMLSFGDGYTYIYVCILKSFKLSVLPSNFKTTIH